MADGCTEQECRELSAQCKDQMLEIIEMALHYAQRQRRYWKNVPYWCGRVDALAELRESITEL